MQQSLAACDEPFNGSAADTTGQPRVGLWASGPLGVWQPIQEIFIRADKSVMPEQNARAQTRISHETDHFRRYRCFAVRRHRCPCGGSASHHRRPGRPLGQDRRGQDRRHRQGRRQDGARYVLWRSQDQQQLRRRGRGAQGTQCHSHRVRERRRRVRARQHQCVDARRQARRGHATGTQRRLQGRHKGPTFLWRDRRAGHRV